MADLTAHALFTADTLTADELTSHEVLARALLDQFVPGFATVDEDDEYAGALVRLALVLQINFQDDNGGTPTLLESEQVGPLRSKHTKTAQAGVDARAVSAASRAMQILNANAAVTQEEPLVGRFR